jgi:hypothetical protein
MIIYFPEDFEPDSKKSATISFRAIFGTGLIGVLIHIVNGIIDGIALFWEIYYLKKYSKIGGPAK